MCTHLGSSLNKCTFNGQQCCSQVAINWFDWGIKNAVNNDKLNFTRGLVGAQNAIDQMRKKTKGISK